MRPAGPRLLYMSMNSTVVIAPPVVRSWPRRWAWPAAGLVVAICLALALSRFWKGGSPEIAGTFYNVVPMDLEIKIAKDGELQAIEFIDIKSEVEGTAQIIELVKEGTTVKKGDRLIVLDSTNLQQRKEELDLVLQKAEAALKIAVETKEIQESQNATNLEFAQVNLQLAKLEEEQYLKGSFPQTLENARTAKAMADINLRNAQEDYEQNRTLFSKGFVTNTDLKKAELAVTVARNDVKKAETALKVLQEYSYPMETTRLRTAVIQAEARLLRVQRENNSLLNQRLADVAEKQQYVDNLRTRLKKLQDQIEACVITAPEDGLVIYASTIDRYRNQVQEGAQVHERQWIIRLPDVRAMKAVLRVPEAMVPRLDVEKKQRASVKIIGVPRRVGATLTRISPLSDSSTRYWNPDLKEYPVELTLDETPPGLKPGVGCQAEIYIDRYEDVLCVPLAAMYSVGKDSYVFVKTPSGVQHRKVTTGPSNETHIQITQGVQEGDQVLLLAANQGRLLLEQAGIKVDVAPATTRDRDRERPADGQGNQGRRNRDGRSGGEPPPRADKPAGPAAQASTR